MDTARVEAGPRRKRRRSEAGFTLIELMVVIVIIGLLVGLVGPRIMIAVDKARVETAKTQISSFRTALQMYKLEFGSYPSTAEGLQALISNDKRNFLEQDGLPIDPWKNAYDYTAPGDQGHDFEILSYGEDGAPGGSDFAADISSWNMNT